MKDMHKKKGKAGPKEDEKSELQEEQLDWSQIGYTGG